MNEDEVEQKGDEKVYGNRSRMVHAPDVSRGSAAAVRRLVTVKIIYAVNNNQLILWYDE